MWVEKRLGEALEVLLDHRGRTPRKLGSDFVSSGVQVISAQNVTRNRLDLTATARFVTPDVADRWMPTPLATGDVLLSSEAPLGCVARIENGAERLCLGQRLFALRPDPGLLDGGYLQAALTCEPVRGRLLARASGTTAQGIKQSQLREVEVPLPPLVQQRAIASVLAALDDKIESNRRLIASEVAARSLAFRRLSQREAARQPLSAIASPQKATIQPSETPLETFEQFSIPAFDAGGDPDVCLGGSMASGKVRLPTQPAILFSKLNPRTPRVWNPVVSGVGTAVCSPEFLVLQAKGEATHAWLDACLRHDERFYAGVLSGVTGTTGSRQRVKPDDMLRATVPAPGPTRIQKWTRFAAPMIAREAALTRESRTVTAIRDALLPKLVSGQIRVPLADDPEEQVAAATDSLAATAQTASPIH